MKRLGSLSRIGLWAHAARDLSLAAVCGRRTPLAVSYIITNRCNYRCSYCYRWRKSGPELDTEQVHALLAGLRRLGTRFLQITGGEPFLRPDLPEVVRRARGLGFYIGLNTNGSLLKERAEVLDHLDRISFSLDGPPEIHERIRPPGAHRLVEEAIALARGRGVPVSLTATLNRYNTEHVDYLLQFAARQGASIVFQPAHAQMLSSSLANAAAGETPRIRAALAQAARGKRAYKNIENWSWELRLLGRWPESQGLACAGGRIFFRIESNGDVMVCGIKDGDGPFPNALKDGLAAALAAVTPPQCDSCFNPTRLRINLLYGLLRRDWRLWRDWLGAGEGSCSRP